MQSLLLLCDVSGFGEEAADRLLIAMESLVHYNNPAHALSVLGLLNEQRLRGQMCDVVLVVADQRNSESITRTSSEQSEASEGKSTFPYTSILKGNPSHIASVRPQLTSSASFSDAEVQHIRLPSATDQDVKEEKEQQEPHFNTKVSFQGQGCEPGQTIDRSGPLIKSLLRRSLSMDSPVPVFSPTLELKELQNSEQSVVKMTSKASGPDISAQNGNSKTISPLALRSKFPSGFSSPTVKKDHEAQGTLWRRVAPSMPEESSSPRAL
ncbi:unnamed protein product [Lampetra planeri]